MWAELAAMQTERAAAFRHQVEHLQDRSEGWMKLIEILATRIGSWLTPLPALLVSLDHMGEGGDPQGPEVSVWEGPAQLKPEVGAREGSALAKSDVAMPSGPEAIWTCLVFSRGQGAVRTSPA